MYAGMPNSPYSRNRQPFFLPRLSVFTSYRLGQRCARQPLKEHRHYLLRKSLMVNAAQKENNDSRRIISSHKMRTHIAHRCYYSRVCAPKREHLIESNGKPNGFKFVKSILRYNSGSYLGIFQISETLPQGKSFKTHPKMQAYLQHLHILHIRL